MEEREMVNERPTQYDLLMVEMFADNIMMEQGHCLAGCFGYFDGDACRSPSKPLKIALKSSLSVLSVLCERQTMRLPLFLTLIFSSFFLFDHLS
jgi:hypothetical protein